MRLSRGAKADALQDNEQARGGRLLLLGKGALFAHRFERSPAAGLDESGQRLNRRGSGDALLPFKAALCRTESDERQAARTGSKTCSAPPGEITISPSIGASPELHAV
jgi:hypothetical protein